jgi:hypothetical protein
VGVKSLVLPLYPAVGRGKEPGSDFGPSFLSLEYQHAS